MACMKEFESCTNCRSRTPGIGGYCLGVGSWPRPQLRRRRQQRPLRWPRAERPVVEALTPPCRPSAAIRGPPLACLLCDRCRRHRPCNRFTFSGEERSVEPFGLQSLAPRAQAHPMRCDARRTEPILCSRLHRLVRPRSRARCWTRRSRQTRYPASLGCRPSTK